MTMPHNLDLDANRQQLPTQWRLHAPIRDRHGVTYTQADTAESISSGKANPDLV